MDEAPACVIRGFCLSSRLALSALIRDLCSTPGTRGRTSNRDCDASIKFVLNSSTIVLYHSVISVINNKTKELAIATIQLLFARAYLVYLIPLSKICHWTAESGTTG